MPRIADFTAIKKESETDKGFLLQIGATTLRAFDFNLEPGAHFKSRSILMFVVSSKDAKNLRLKIRVNGADQISYSFPEPFGIKTLHELVNPIVLHANPNTVEFEITGTSGSVFISDPVLHYQRDI